MTKYKKKAWLFLTALMITSLIFVWNGEAAADKLADGTYEVNYTVKKPDDESASIANDYFEKPARVEVSNGEAVMYFQTNHNKWIASLRYPAGAEGVELEVVDADEAADTKVVRLPHKDIFEPALLTVDVKIDELGYDLSHTVRFVFDTNHLPLLEETVPDAEDVIQPSEPEPNSGADVIEQDQTIKEEGDGDPQTADPDRLMSDSQEGEPVVPGSDADTVDESEPLIVSSDPRESFDAESADDTQQTAVQLSAENPDNESSERSTWLVVIAIVLVGCALAAFGFMYRLKRE